MKYLALLLLLASPAYASDNKIHKDCLAKHGYDGINGNTDFMSIASCVHKIRVEIRKQKEDELWEFMKKNPHYRYPGVALPNGQKKPLHPCWGKDRRISTENSYSC